MGGRVRVWCLVAMVLLGVAGTALAQDATLAGTVKDSSGAVLPGVTVTAVHEASGNTFVAVTDQAGAFRLLMRTGSYRVTVELAGFATVVRTANLLLGQTAAVTLEMAPSTIQESVTVTGEAPLLDTASSSLAGNIDPRQMQELPLNGRNWMDLAMLAPGSRQNQSGGVPLLRQGYSQINIDGQQVTNNYIGIGDDQPRFSRDSIAEFELLTNRFDATQGRSAGMIANAITKSGTNALSGSVAGYFRDDAMNAKDKVQNVVLPYSNQQVSTTLGGPIRKDRVHFFGNYEYEREPQVLVYSATGPLAIFNQNIDAPRRQWTYGMKIDTQFSSNLRLSVRANGYEQNFYQGGGATSHPSTAASHQRFTRQQFGQMTWVLNSSTVNVIKAGYSTFNRNNDPLVKTNGGKNQFMTSLRDGAPIRINFRGYTAGTVVQHHNQDLVSFRDDLTTAVNARGRHELKTGVEYIHNLANLIGCGSLCSPRIIAQNGAPTTLPLARIFPVWNDAGTWNINLIAPVAQRYEASYTDVPGFFRDIVQHNVGAWLQDDWKVASKFTLNLGLRYDMQNHVGPELNLSPFLPGDRGTFHNWAPRVGFAYTVTDRTVVRGGYGKFFAQGTADEAHQTILYMIGISPVLNYDGRADWASNPWNGPTPSYTQIVNNACDVNGNRTGCFSRQFIPEIANPFWRTPYSHQSSIGIEHQIGSAMALQTNVVYTGGRLEEGSRNINLTYNPATGANYPSTDVSRRAFPQFGPVQMAIWEGRSNYYGWENSLTKRMSNHWQLSATYTLSQFKDSKPDPWKYSIQNNRLVREAWGFKIAPDLGAEYTLAATDQRHRAVLNGIYEAKYGIQVSGVYFYGSGQRYATSYGGDQRSEAAGGEARLRPDGTIVSRNALVGKPIHRVDLRVQKRVSLGGHVTADGMLELFNAFNHANYGTYTTQESAGASYGQPEFNNNISYQPRGVQLGFRIQF